MTRVCSTTMRICRHSARQRHVTLAPARSSRQGRAWASVSASAALASVFCAAALLAACGGSSPTAASVSPSPSFAGPTPVPSPQITSGGAPTDAVAVVRRYWTLLGVHSYDAAFALTTGSHIENAGAQPKVIESARYLSPVGRVFPTPGEDATVEFGSWVRIVPTATGSPFGTEPRRWEMFARVTRMSDGSWRLVELGTGP